MNRTLFPKLIFLTCLATATSLLAQSTTRRGSAVTNTHEVEVAGPNELTVPGYVELPGQAKPTWVSISGLTGEADSTLRFDLYVQGFNFTNAQAAQYQITGSNNGNLQARAVDPHSKSTLVNKIYSGVPLRQQVHAFSDEFVAAMPEHRKGIAQTRFAFKGESGRHSEIYISDFDGHNALQETKDNSIVAAPSWVPGHMALYYVSYKLDHTDIFYHDLSTGARRAFARYPGSNLGAAASFDGRKVAMILGKDGWVDLYVADAAGGEPKRLTRSPQDESSPCWSPDGKWICFAGKEKEHRTLCKVSPSGGALQQIGTGGTRNPSEPDWSPDGKWIAFTSQGSGFAICVVPADGGAAVTLVEGEDPSWAPNSRTLAYCRRQAGHYVLSLLDVPTKQYKNVSRIPGLTSQSQPSWAK